ncbi:carboxypeptidase regulatory-like domain-containing protein [Opitutus sp. ER46]|uniref:TonB-dependent receptor n=1 Tax=Opitutus sp. ER46 TaxID=2161864 RepID=UPI001304FD3C|nr:carboxypeptidase regulatory-like domain-containing protein [Opitutus sp. ER46]
MKRSSHITRVLAALFALSFAFASAAFGQGITTAALSGSVSNKQGTPVAGATVTLVHEPSNTTVTTVTRANGLYDFSGLRIGGPYTVTANGEVRRDLFLDLGQTAEVNFPLDTEIVKMQAFSVTGERDTAFDSNRMGAGSNFTDEQIQNLASMRSDVQDIARLDSRLLLTSLDQGGQLSAQGQNFRFNSFLIDGVEANDPFGLNSNGVSSLRGPIPLEALQALNIELNPYDVRRSGFTGALMNAVTKSGTNRYEGSAYYEFTDDGMRAKNPRTGDKEYFEERRWGVTVGGPILKNRLFFFFSYDDFRRDSSAPVAGFKFSAESLALIDQVLAKVKSMGYDAGSFAGAENIATQKTYLAKIDWNISKEHRLSFTYRKNEGTTPVFSGVTSTSGSSLSNYWYDTPRTTESYTAQLFSQWTPDFRTEVSWSRSDYNASPKNRGTPFPAVGIGDLTGTRTDTGAAATGYLNFGTEFSRQLNELNTKEMISKITGEYSLGNHVIAAGAEVNSTKYDNRFLQAYYGSYTFRSTKAWGTTPARSSVENFLLGLPTSYTDAQPLAGYTIDNVFARWTYDAYAFLLQDTWRPTQRLTLTGGLRYDIPTVDQAPPYNAAFDAAFGIRNDYTIDGNSTLAPRLGFNYRVPASRRTEVRGGVGLFQGRNPAVWLANAYQNAGTASSITVNVNGQNSNGTLQPTLQFQPDVTKQPIPAGTAPTPTINLTADGFKMPSIWKGNLAVDHELPFWNLVATAEVTATQVEKGLFIDFLNYKEAGVGTVMPDGRIRYAGTITPNITGTPSTSTGGRRRVSTFADVYRINNTSKGESHDFTLALRRPMKNHWAASVAWTRGHATEVSPMTSSTAGSLYTTRAVFNPNEEVASTSNTNARDKIVAQYTRQFDFFKIKDTRTTLTLVYEGRTGHPYSWVFKGDANGDGIADNDLFYMPTGPDDSKVTWKNTAERDAFFAFAQTSTLSKYYGQVLSRNSESSPWTQTVDLTLRQQIPVFRRVRAEAYFQIMNLFNLLNDEWGLLDEVPFTYKRRVAGTEYDAAANKYVYYFNSNTLDGVPTVADETQASRWQIKVGMRITF